MTQFTVVLQNEVGDPLDGQVEFFSGGAPVGAAGVHKGGSTILIAEEVPEGTDKYRFTSPGYSWYSTSNIYDTNTITLVKEIDPTRYLLIGAVLVGGAWLLSRLKL